MVTWEGVGLNEWDRYARKSLPLRWLSPFRYPSLQTDTNIYLSSRLGSRLIEDAKGNLVYATTQTGKDLPSLYKETSAGGLAMQYRNNNVIPTGLEFQED